MTDPFKPPSSAGKEALQLSADIIKFTVAIASGALAISTSLVTKDSLSSSSTWVLLILTWLMLAISVGAGVLALFRIPMQLAFENYNIRDRYFEWPGRVHVACLIL